MLRVKSLLVIFGGLFAACSVFDSSTTQKAAPDELFYVSKYNLEKKTTARGFMDKTGKFVVGPWETFEWNGVKYGSDSNAPLSFEVMQFVEGMAGICFYDEAKSSLDAYGKYGKCGFIDKTGKIVVEPKYKKIGYFSDGLAAVSEEDKYDAKFGYIDKTGKMIIEPKFLSKNPFSDGLAAVRESTSESKLKDGYIDKTGKFVIEKDYIGLSNFADGHAIVVDANQQRIVIDKNGKQIKTTETRGAGNTDYFYKKTLRGEFYRGYAVEDSTMPAFSGNLAMVQIHGSRTDTLGFLNTKGEMEIPLDAERVGEIRPFADGFAPIGWRLDEAALRVLGYSVPEGTYDWTFVDRKGDFKVRLDDTFIDARPFSEGLAAVKPRKGGDNWGFINTEFKLVIPACFHQINDFRAGLAEVYLSASKTGCEQYADADGDIYIDKTGNVVKPQW